MFLPCLFARQIGYSVKLVKTHLSCRGSPCTTQPCRGKRPSAMSFEPSQEVIGYILAKSPYVPPD